MKVVHISTYDIVGGAARAAYRIHEGLRRAGVDSSMLVLRKRSEDPNVQVFKPPHGLVDRVKGRLHRQGNLKALSRYERSRPKGLEPFTLARSECGASVLAQLPPCDVLHLHWISGFIDYQSVIQNLPKGLPVVWTLHDMNPFTGGCHYTGGCSRFNSQCGRCPQLGSNTEADISRVMWKLKAETYKAFERRCVALVSPSQWLAGEIRQSGLLGRFPVHVIPYGIDTDVFASRDKQAAREVLGIPKDARVLLFVAQSLTNERKGVRILGEAINQCDSKADLCLLCVGANKLPITIEVPIHFLGTTQNDRILSMAYSAADLFVIPSLQDNLPNTVLEALSCGTPVVGFAVGGIPDMIEDGVNGKLVTESSAPALGKAFFQLLDQPDLLAQMMAASRRIALERYRLDNQSRRYQELYEELSAAKASATRG